MQRRLPDDLWLVLSCDLMWAWHTLLRCHAHFRSSHVIIMQTFKNANNYLSMQRRRLPDDLWLDHVIRFGCGLNCLTATPFWRITCYKINKHKLSLKRWRLPDDLRTGVRSRDVVMGVAHFFLLPCPFWYHHVTFFYGFWPCDFFVLPQKLCAQV